MMDTNLTNSEEPNIIPLAKTDWIRFGALKIQAKSKRIWQATAIIAIFGIVAITVTDGWLFMNRRIRTEQLRHEMEVLANQNKMLALRLSTLKSAITEYDRLISMTTNEKNQLAIEKGILQAQTELLMSQIETLEASINITFPDSPQQRQEDDETPHQRSESSLPSQVPPDTQTLQRSEAPGPLRIHKDAEVSYVPVE